MRGRGRNKRKRKVIDGRGGVEAGGRKEGRGARAEKVAGGGKRRREAPTPT